VVPEPMTSIVASGQLRRPACARHRGKFAACHPNTSRPRTTPKETIFTLAGRSPFSRLIYPVPVPGGLGCTSPSTSAARPSFGPDVEWIAGIDYTVDPHRADKFYAAVRKYCRV